jgi:hypothetical protein
MHRAGLPLHDAADVRRDVVNRFVNTFRPRIEAVLRDQ